MLEAVVFDFDWKFSGSLSAITPSKSKTTASSMGYSSCLSRPSCPSLPLLTFLDSFACAHWNVQPVFGRRIGTVECRVVVAVRVICAVEVDHVDAAGVAIEIQIPAGR